MVYAQGQAAILDNGVSLTRGGGREPCGDQGVFQREGAGSAQAPRLVTCLAHLGNSKDLCAWSSEVNRKPGHAGPHGPP